MIEAGYLAVAIHVLFAGFWIATEAGALIAARHLDDPDLGVAARKAVDRYHVVFRELSRTSMIVGFGIGVYVTHDRGLGFRDGTWRTLALVAVAGSIMWLVAIWYMHVVHFRMEQPSEVHTRFVEIVHHVEVGWRAFVTVFLIVAGVGTLRSAEPGLLDVLGYKMLLLAAIVVLSTAVPDFRVPHVGAGHGVSDLGHRIVRSRWWETTVGAVTVVLVFLTIWTSVSGL